MISIRGVFEGAIIVDDAMSAGDKAALFKTFTKITAQQHNKMACFMAKWSNDWPGQSGHLHMSLTDLEGNSAFYDPDAEHNMSKTMRQFIAGCQKLLPEVLCMVAPTINSFSRMVPGAWAPIDATWGVENRTCALRVIPGSAKSQRVEYRLCAADVNPSPRVPHLGGPLPELSIPSFLGADLSFFICSSPSLYLFERSYPC